MGYKHITKTMRFYKTPENKWFADIQKWSGPTSDLEMMLGADTMLDIIAQGEREVVLGLSNTPAIFLITSLEFVSKKESGAEYTLSVINGIGFQDLKVWLCIEIIALFGGYPKNIYIC